MSEAARDILKAARALPERERRWLARELLAARSKALSEKQRLAAMDRWIADAGIGRSDHSDLSSDKYKHLAEVYADE